VVRQIGALGCHVTSRSMFVSAMIGSLVRDRKHVVGRLVRPWRGPRAHRRGR
jgi:hypothetical protein